MLSEDCCVPTLGKKFMPEKNRISSHKKTWLIFSRVSDVLCFALFTTATLTFEIDEKTIISAVAEDDIIGKKHALKNRINDL